MNGRRRRAGSSPQKNFYRLAPATNSSFDTFSSTVSASSQTRRKPGLSIAGLTGYGVLPKRRHSSSASADWFSV